MGNIVLLDDLTINKIAAGEVIERPASVIKEMVENSIDAGAKNITIEIKNGGISFIRITDNGKGIAKDDVEIAFERHATSKIRNADDLEKVKSMGFRGEALASISAIANVELVTKTADDEIGTRIVVEGGDVLSLDEIGCSKGTTITVRNLFYNTPVRYKFLKKDFTESGYIEDIVTRIALIHPEIAIKFINTGKTVIQTNGNGDLTAVIYSIFGKEIASNIINVDYEYEYMKIKGVIGKPDIARSNRSNQIFFVNERYIKDKTLSSAVEQAFKGMLPIGKFAFLVLNIEMPPSQVDVNVHPAKLEVRFADENIAFKAVFHAVKNTLLNSGFISERDKAQEIKEASKQAFKIENVQEVAKKTYSVENKNMVSNQEFMEKLKILQDEIKQEVEKNPNLQLTEKYKEMEQKYNEIIIPVINQNDLPKALKNSEIFKKQIEKSEENTVTESVENKAFENAEESLKSEISVENINDEILEEREKNINNEISKEEREEDINREISEEEKNTSNEISKEESEENINREISEEEKNTNNEILKEESEENINSEILKEEKNTSNEIAQEERNDTNEQLQNGEKITVEKEILSFEEMYKQLFGKEPYGGRKQETPKEEKNYYTIDDNIEDVNVSLFEDDETYNKITYKFIGIAFDTYIILEINNEIYIMDQHAAHERILYEKVKKNFFEEGEKASQLLLLPDIITLTHKEMDIARDNFALFRQAGFMLEEFGENTIKLSGVPEICIDLNTQELFRETLDEINTVARTAKQEKEEKFIATVACKAAVKANMKLTKEEVDSLMSQLLELPNPFTCPHGRPTVIKMSKYEIERKFARK